MAIKVVMLFQQSTNQVGPTATPSASAPAIGYILRLHLAGWTESVWWPSDDLTSLIPALRTGFQGHAGLLPARAGMLPFGCDIVGVRLYQGGAGRGQSLGIGAPGAFATSEDIPQMAILFKGAPTTIAVTRRWVCRGVPDFQVNLGEFNPGATYVTAIQQYFDALANFGFYAWDPSVPKFNVVNVSTVGVVAINGAFPPFALNQVVTIQQTVDSGGIRRSYTGQITALDPTNNRFTLGNPAWTFGVTTGGKVWARTKALFLFNSANCTAVRIVTRRVGRPFEQYRGRRSRRRR